MALPGNKVTLSSNDLRTYLLHYLTSLPYFITLLTAVTCIATITYAYSHTLLTDLHYLLTYITY